MGFISLFSDFNPRSPCGERQALGNGMAGTAMKWIGEEIEQVNEEMKGGTQC